MKKIDILNLSTYLKRKGDNQLARIGHVNSVIDNLDNKIDAPESPNDGDALVYNGTTGLWEAQNISPITYQVGDFAYGGVIFWIDELGQHGLVANIIDASDGSASPYLPKNPLSPQLGANKIVILPFAISILLLLMLAKSSFIASRYVQPITSIFLAGNPLILSIWRVVSSWC